MEGHIIRSCVQWLNDGEKPTKYFCTLENKQYIEKTVKKIKNENNENILDQEEILNEIRLYYSRLFDNRDNQLENVVLKNLLKDYNIPRLTDEQYSNLDGVLTINELSDALMYLKNYKTPGLDGFPALNFFILRSINYSYKTGCLLPSLRHCIISCLPKGNKPREY